MKVYDVRALPGDAAFLICDGAYTILYDTGFAFTGAAVAEKIKTITDRLDYIFLTHSHYDHAAGSPYVKRAFPGAVVVAGEYAEKIFAKPSAKAVMRDLDGKFAAKNGVLEYEDLIDELQVELAVRDGDLIGETGYRAVSLPGHTRCSIGYYSEEKKLLLSSETLGVYDGQGGVVPSYLIGVQTALDSIARVEGMEIEQMLLPHYGLISGDEVRAYLKAARENALTTRDRVLEILKDGTREDAINWFRDTYYHGYSRVIYPEDAMLLNTGITVDLIAREYGMQNAKC